MNTSPGVSPALSPQGFRSTVIGSAKLLLLVLRHIGAPLVSFVVSYATAFLLAVPLGLIGITLGRGGQGGFDLLCAAAGYCGVISGARCLPHITRRPGSIVLVLLGLIYFYCFVADWGNQITDEGKLVNMNGLWLVRLVFLALGGLLATVTIWWSPPHNSPQPN